jgi:NAD-dependent dihydropyrimidine dehydrogenase PreA subunit
MRRLLEFELFSGGKIIINLEKCENCESKACIAMCNAPKMGGILELKEGRPSLKVSPEEARKGGCIECLGCELNCQLYGKNAIEIRLPMHELDTHLDTLDRW